MRRSAFKLDLRMIGWLVVGVAGLLFLLDYSRPERVIARQERAHLESYLEQVGDGDMSFEQAGCEYRGGEWDRASRSCTPFEP